MRFDRQPAEQGLPVEHRPLEEQVVHLRLGLRDWRYLEHSCDYENMISADDVIKY